MADVNSKKGHLNKIPPEMITSSIRKRMGDSFQKQTKDLCPVALPM